jgi:hypothetical protein
LGLAHAKSAFQTGADQSEPGKMDVLRTPTLLAQIDLPSSLFQQGRAVIITPEVAGGERATSGDL